MELWRPVLRLILLAASVSGVAGVPATAAVEISFYSREFGVNNFPHAFVVLKGRLDSGGSVIDESYGFTAKAITPAILMGSVGGKVIREPASYIAKSDKQFALVLSDEAYGSVSQIVDAWRAKAQPSYNLNKSNCLHFVGEVAKAAGLNVTFAPALMKKPRAFLAAIRDENEDLIVAR